MAERHSQKVAAERNVIVTGIPRSGTTLAAALIDGLSDTVCLNEPHWHTARAAKDASGFAQWIEQDFEKLRRALLNGEPVPDRRAHDGKAVTNYYRSHDGGMENTFDIVPFTRPGLGADFTLAIKHNGPYLAVLPDLIASSAFTIIAIIRHPVEVIYSWRSLKLPISRGEMPNAAAFWPELAAIIRQDVDLLEKQVKLYDLMCQRIYEYRAQLHLLPYEMLVKEPQRLAGYLDNPGIIDKSLIGSPSHSVPEKEKEHISAALEKYAGHYRHFYNS
jgi:hypothetical protein